MGPTGPKRRHCCECRKMYEPQSSAEKTQKTCSKKCRGERRARQARDRYASDRKALRRWARERQRRHRASQAARSGPELVRLQVPAAVVQYIAERMTSLSAEGWLSRGRVAIELRKVAQVAVDSGM